jgi:glutaconate CoA-transferase subunit B
MEYGHAEMMCVALAREIKEGDVVFHGLASPVPMTAIKLAKALGKEFIYVNITGGVDPDITKPAIISSTLSRNQYEGTTAHFGLDEIFDLAGTGRVDISFLSLIQIDQAGKINMSYVGGTWEQPKLRLPGGAGSAFLTPVCDRTTIWKTKHDDRSLVEKVQFTTAAADAGKQLALVTNLCVFRMKDGLLRLDSIFPYSSFEEVQKNTGWTIDETKAPHMDPPTDEELAALDKIDPNKIRMAEF